MRAALALLVAGLLAAGCGESDERDAATPSPSANGPEAQPGGAGDELPARQTVRLTIGEQGISPKLVKVSAFFGVELEVHNETGREQVIGLRRRAVSVAPGEVGRLRLAGLRRGRYTIEGYAAGRATLVSSLDEP